jgi:uncharacterized membrane protein YcaP (DUF421 family)
MDLVLRATAIFVLVFLFTRVLGRRELSQLQPFDLILLVVVGDLIQQSVTQNDMSGTGAALVLGTIAVLQVGISYLSYRFRRLRPILQGEPIVIVQDGRPIERNMKRERLTMEDVTEEARLQGISSLEQVRWAVLETSGRISFIKDDRAGG